MQQTTIDALAQAKTVEDAIYVVCKLAARAGDMAYHGYTAPAIQAAVTEAQEAAQQVPVRGRLIATQDAAAIYSTHALHRVRREGEAFAICHICGDGIAD